MPNWPERPWTEAYFDIVEQFFRAQELTEYASAAASKKPVRWWERLRRPPAPSAGRLRREQVPLDRLLGLFVTLAPAPLVSEIIETATGWPCMGPFRLLGEGAWRRLGLGEAERPDVIFASSEAVFILEVKVAGARAGLEQIVTDALLVQQIRASLMPARCGVLYLAPAAAGEIAPPNDWGALRQAAIRRLPRMKQQRLAGLDADGRVILADTISAFELATMSFVQFDYLLGGYASGAAPAEVESKLIDGMRRELRVRGLADAPYLASDMSLVAGG